MTARSLETFPIHLGLGATAVPQPAFPRNEAAMDWYMDYARRNEADGFDGRLVASYTFSESWPMWEMHPNGAEVVICTAGRMTLHQELADGSEQTVTLGPGEYAINPPGAWHTADIDGAASAVFVTSGIGTQHRPR
jgi:mannose-6-phosphate isomerase-like protein (cupin superfamily)